MYYSKPWSKVKVGYTLLKLTPKWFGFPLQGIAFINSNDNCTFCEKDTLENLGNKQPAAYIKLKRKSTKIKSLLNL